jgi:hypothetical protein
MIKHVRIGKSLGHMKDFRNILTGKAFRANDPGQGSGWKAYYDKNGKSITFEEVNVMQERRTIGDAYLRVIGGLYTGRLDVDFFLTACHELTIDGKAVVVWSGFSFWLVASCDNPSNLVLRIRTSYRTTEEALGTLLESFTDEAGNILMGGTSNKYMGHIRELIVEFQSPVKTGLEDFQEADLKIPEALKPFVAVIHQELGREVDLKAFRVYGRSIDNHEQRLLIKYQGKYTVQWEKLTHGPIQQEIMYGYVGGLRRR